MASAKDALRRQRRRELDSKRSKCRVRLGSCLQGWGELKDELGFTLHSQLAHFLLQSYFSKQCSRCKGGGKEVNPATVSTTEASLHQLVLLVHRHGQHCSVPPTRAGPGADPAEAGPPVGASRRGRGQRRADVDPEASTQACEVETHLTYVCERGHGFTWHPVQVEVEGNVGGEKHGEAPPLRKKRSREQGRRKGRQGEMEHVQQNEVCNVVTRSCSKAQCVSPHREKKRTEDSRFSAEDEEPEWPRQDVGSQEEGSDAVVAVLPPKNRSLIVHTEDCENIGDENQSPDDSANTSAVPILTKRGRQRRVDGSEKNKNDLLRTVKRKTSRQQPVKDDMSQINGKRKRKAAPKLILPCEFEGCWKIFSSRQYLNHHMKYQHVHQKTFSCSHPSCGKSFNFKKHLKEHEKLHSDQRDYICEFCARAFRTSSNLSIHRRIHTGEKPLQCEVCGFTCRQKASLNWHMRKHDTERSYQFPCDICGRRFEKRDNVTAHRSKSHPEPPTPSADEPRPLSPCSTPKSLPQLPGQGGDTSMTLGTFTAEGDP